jgi:hypothetical protein
MALKDWIKVDELRYQSKANHSVQTAHYGNVYGMTEIMTSKLDTITYVSMMVNGIITYYQPYSTKEKAKKYIMNYIRNHKY